MDRAKTAAYPLSAGSPVISKVPVPPEVGERALSVSIRPDQVRGK